MEQTVPPTNTYEPLNLTGTQLADIQNMARLGMCETFIANKFHTDSETLLEKCGAEMATARLNANLEVLESLYKMAVSAKNMAATAFWIKTHCTDILPQPPEKAKSLKDKDDWGPNDANKRITFTVYNNDGEPNADY